MVATLSTPPATAEVYEFSYNPASGKFRWRLEGQEWLVDAIAGQAEIVESNGQTHRWKLRCRLQVVDGEAFAWLPSDCDLAAVNAHVPEGAKDSHYRLCANIAGNDWRVRDERTDELTMVAELRGVLNLNWFDHGSHVFHDGRLFIDPVTHVAYFAGDKR